MPSWKKVVTSGSQAELAAVSASIALRVGTNQQITSTQSTTFLSGSFTGSFTGPLTGTASWASNAVNANTASYVLNAVSSSRATTAASSDVSYAVATTPFSDNRPFYIPYLNASNTSFQDLYSTASLTYNPATQLLTATASRAVTASFALTANLALSSSIANTTDNATYWLTFVPGAGNRPISTNTSGLTYNPSSNVFSGSKFETQLYVYSDGSAVTPKSGIVRPIFTNASDTYASLFTTSSYNFDLGTQTLYVNNISSSRVTATTVSASAVTASATLIGTTSAQAFTTTIQQSNISAGSTIIYSLPTSSYEAMFFKYAMRSGSASSVWVQTGEIYTMRSGVSDAIGTQTSTANAPFNLLLNRLSVTILNGNFTISGSFTSGSWAVRGIVQVI